MMLPNRDVVVRRTGVKAHVLPDGSVLLYESISGTAFPLNESGGKIWDFCAESRTADEIVEMLAEHYEAPRTDLDRDTREFLAMLVGHGLLDQQSSTS